MFRLHKYLPLLSPPLALTLILAATSQFTLLATSPAQSSAATHLEVNAATEALGIDDPHPRFSWRVSGVRTHARQALFRLLVATKAELLKPNNVDVWDSQLVRSDKTALIYNGPTLKSRTRYYW